MTQLGYKKQLGAEVGYWFGEVEGADRQFIRVAAGVAMPILERSLGGVVIVGEIYNQAIPASFWLLDARVGEWGEVKTAMVQFRRDYLFGEYVTDTEQARMVLMEDRDIYGGEPPLISDYAEPWMTTEVGRSAVAQLRAEGRFHIPELVEKYLEFSDGEPSYLAIQSVTCKLQRRPAIYTLPQQRRGFGRVLGVEGL